MRMQNTNWPWWLSIRARRRDNSVASEDEAEGGQAVRRLHFSKFDEGGTSLATDIKPAYPGGISIRSIGNKRLQALILPLSAFSVLPDHYITFLRSELRSHRRAHSRSGRLRSCLSASADQLKDGAT